MFIFRILKKVFRFFFPKNWQYELMVGMRIGETRGKKIADKYQRRKERDKRNKEKRGK